MSITNMILAWGPAWGPSGYLGLECMSHVRAKPEIFCCNVLANDAVSTFSCLVLLWRTLSLSLSFCMVFVQGQSVAVCSPCVKSNGTKRCEKRTTFQSSVLYSKPRLGIHRFLSGCCHDATSSVLGCVLLYNAYFVGTGYAGETRENTLCSLYLYV